MNAATPSDSVRTDVRVDWEWAAQFEREAIGHAVQQMFIKCSDMETDQAGVDWQVNGKADVACRLRRVRSAGRYRDFTLRYARSSGVETELSKIRRGVGDFYVYGWVENCNVEEYIVVSLDVFRRCGLAFEERIPTPNKDRRSSFVAYQTNELWDCGCIVAGKKHPGCAISYRWLPNEAKWHVPKLANY